MKLSVIIPAFNEAGIIEQTVEKINVHPHILEIIVVDGGSTDTTAAKAANGGARVVHSPRKGRAAQMNFGARQARGDVLYFLHADSHPPEDFPVKIGQALSEGHQAGCFQLEFDKDHFLLKIYAWFTRFDIDSFRFGDQSLFIKRDLFFEIKGFREDHMVMEDQEIVRRIKRRHSFALLDETITTSSRKYMKTGVIKLQLIFVLVFILYKLGIPQSRIALIYEKLIQRE